MPGGSPPSPEGSRVDAPVSHGGDIAHRILPRVPARHRGRRNPREKARYVIRSVLHALEVLEQFRGTCDQLGVTEISNRLNLHKNKVFRLLASLQSRNYVEQIRSKENYRLGVACFELGQRFVRHSDLLTRSGPILQGLARLSAETSFLAVLCGDDVVFVDAIEATSTIRVVSPVGSRIPFHAAAAGKVLVAFEPDHEIRRRFNAEPRRFTAKTVTDAETFLSGLAAAREKGYATDLDEFEDGLRSVAAPVRNAAGTIVGAVGVSGPAHRLPEGKLETILGPAVARFAEALSTRIGYRGPGDPRCLQREARVPDLDGA